MEQQTDIALELADRLSILDIGMFKCVESSVRLSGANDYYVELRPVSAGRGRPYEVERALAKVASDADYVIVARSFTPGALRLLRDAGANYMDARRLHVQLSTPLFLVHVVDGEERIPPGQEISSGLVSLAGAAGAVAITILENPNEALRVTELAQKARVAPATAQKVVFALEAEGLLRSEGRGPQKVRRVVDPSGLLDRYAADAAADRRLLVRCRVLDDDVFGIARQATEGLEQAGVQTLVTGAVAAAIEAPALTEVPIAELWVHGPRSPEYLLRAVDGIESDKSANLLLWRATTRGPWAGAKKERGKMGLRLASPFRVYADLLASPQRGREQAEIYREQVIGF